MKLLAIPAIVGAALCLSLLPSAQPAAFAQVTLQYGHSTGQTLNYKLTVTTPNIQANRVLELNIARNVAAVDSQGVMTIDTSFTSGTLTANGRPADFPMTGSVLSAKMNRRGVPSETTATGQLAQMLGSVGVGVDSTTPDIFRSLGVLEFPDTAVDPSDTWSVPKSHTMENGDTLDITYNYTYDSDETLNGFACAKILIDAQTDVSLYGDNPQVLRGMFMKGSISQTGTLWFAYSEGRIVKLEETIETTGLGIHAKFDGSADIAPIYTKTEILLELQP